MRYLLLIALALSGMTFLAPKAEARGYRDYHYRGHHSHHHRYYPSRRVVYRSHYYRPSYYRTGYYGGYYARPYYGGYYDNCYPAYRSYYRPRFAISFGF